MDLTTFFILAFVFFVLRWFIKEWLAARKVVMSELAKSQLNEGTLIRIEAVKDKFDSDVFLVYNVNTGKFICQGFTDNDLKLALYQKFNGKEVSLQFGNQVIPLDFSKLNIAGIANG